MFSTLSNLSFVIFCYARLANTCHALPYKVHASSRRRGPFVRCLSITKAKQEHVRLVRGVHLLDLRNHERRALYHAYFLRPPCCALFPHLFSAVVFLFVGQLISSIQL